MSGIANVAKIEKAGLLVRQLEEVGPLPFRKILRLETRRFRCAGQPLDRRGLLKAGACLGLQFPARP
jgi:hypothetical protein